MNTPEERILAYPHLSREDQHAVDTYVDGHPEWQPLLSDVKALEARAAEAQLFNADDPGDEVLATYIVAQQLYPDRVSDQAPTALANAFANVEARLRTDSSLRARYDAMQRRVEAVERHVDPVAQVEALTGHRIPGATDADASDAVASSAYADREPSTDGASVDGRAARPAASDRPAATSSRGSGSRLSSFGSVARTAALAVALVVGAYGALYGVSWTTQSTAERLAVMDVDEDVINSFQDVRTRSATPADTVTADAIYLRALPLLRDARTTTMGLFPHFDPQKLAEAEQLLNRVVASTERGSFLQLEAHFYLGKVRLAQGRVNEARSHFKAVVQHEGRRATEAYRILKRLEEEHPAGSNASASARSHADVVG